ncbi:MAG: 4Fe-4S dicluster domain-containing protein [Desulfobacterales bacterium]|nr:4Fe-4S dicluster domain-containing protein [Desulfobacterales bacterium]MDD4070922.1 4Fe-4S dicluster domain-containing protein [Desulfobacterales bacterium]MDD4393244.1 4Fe-4S dicluster domain-containing protein [Desulfobacterales bacterium]
MPKQEKVLVIDPDKCTGCHSCEMACSAKHFGKCSPYLSRIRIHDFGMVGTYVPVTCQACEDAPCIKVCPMNARIRIESGAVITDESKCIGCRACTYACPFGAPVINPESGKTMSCDLCMDDELGPWCAKACTLQEAIRFVNIEDAARARGRDMASIIKKEIEPPAQDDGDFVFSFSV